MLTLAVGPSGKLGFQTLGMQVFPQIRHVALIRFAFCIKDIAVSVAPTHCDVSPSLFRSVM